jgi:hypothetical protein
MEYAALESCWRFKVMLLTYGAILTAGIILVMIPVALETYTEFKGPREIECPETGVAATIRLNAARAAAASAVGATRLEVISCSRWPARRDCDRACLGQIKNL